MSAETSEWLNRNTLIGMTDKRGKAWHYRASDQGDEPNHYPGPIPIGDVHRRLFYWEARPVEIALAMDCPVGVNEDGTIHTERGYDEVPVAGLRAIQRSDTGQVFMIATDGYAVHQYQDVLLRQAESMLGSGLVIGTAGLLKGGGRAWVCCELPDTITVAGLDVRPSLLAASSHDGSMAIVFKLIYGIPVCDNTLTMALGEKTPTVRFRHTSGSGDRVAVVADALGLVEDAHTQASRVMERLATAPVTPAEFDAIVAALIKPGPGTGKNGETIAVRQRGEVRSLWESDDRVAPVAGTALGVLQAMNTWRHHVKTQRGGGTHRSERNMLDAIGGNGERADRATLTAIGDVLGKGVLVPA